MVETASLPPCVFAFRKLARTLLHAAACLHCPEQRLQSRRVARAPLMLARDAQDDAYAGEAYEGGAADAQAARQAAKARMQAKRGIAPVPTSQARAGKRGAPDADAPSGSEDDSSDDDGEDDGTPMVRSDGKVRLDQEHARAPRASHDVTLVPALFSPGADRR